jgi:hypothetical protein
MKQPFYHNVAHPMWNDQWNPYLKRDEAVFLLDNKIIDTLLSPKHWRDGEFDCWATGCLDAPEEIPLGATESIKTISGFYKENYMRLNRSWSSFDNYLVASEKMSELLKTMLKDI